MVGQSNGEVGRRPVEVEILVRVDRKGRVVIPQAVREACGIRPGQYVKIRIAVVGCYV